MFSYKTHPFFFIIMLLGCGLRKQLNPQQLSTLQSFFSYSYKPAWQRSNSSFISYLAQSFVHYLYHIIKVSYLECLVTSVQANLEDKHSISGLTSMMSPANISFSYKYSYLSLCYIQPSCEIFSSYVAAFSVQGQFFLISVFSMCT